MGLLATTLAIAAFVGVALWSATGLFSLVMVAAGYLMADPILYDHQRRKSATRLVGCAAIYAAVTIAVALVLFGISSGFIVLWLMFGILLGPVVMIVAAGIWAAQAGKVSRLASMGFILWMLGLGFVNLFWLGELLASRELAERVPHSGRHWQPGDAAVC